MSKISNRRNHATAFAFKCFIKFNKTNKENRQRKQHKMPHSLVSSYSLQVLHRRNEARALVLANCGSASALLDTEKLHWTAAPLCWISAPVFHLIRSVRKKCILVINSLRFDGHFPGEPGLAGVYWSKGWWRWWWQLDYWSNKSYKASVKSSPPTNQHPVFLQVGCPSCRPTNSVKALIIIIVC